MGLRFRFTFGFGGEVRPIEIDPAGLAGSHPQIKRLRTHFLEKAGGKEALADQALAGFLAKCIHSYGTEYLARVNGAMKRIHAARESLSAEFERVAGGDVPDLAKIKSGFDEIDLAFPEVIDPVKGIDAAPLKLPPLKEVKPPRDARSLEGVLNQVRRPMRDLTAAERGLLDLLEQSEPEALRKALAAEEPESLRISDDPTAEAESPMEKLRARLQAEGKSAEEIDAMTEVVKKLNVAWRGGGDVPASYKAQLAEAIARLPSSRLQNAVRRSKVLQRLLYDTPERLLRYWDAYMSKPRRYGFGLYVFFNMLHVKGHLGEYSAAFALGDRIVFLKGPKAEVTTGGTDLVGIDVETGDVWTIDNKAVKAKYLSEVSALTRNLPQNLAEDVAAFRAEFAGREVHPRVEAAIRRLEIASRRIARLVAGKTKEQVETDSAMQAEITQILRESGVERVVTNTGGKLEKLSAALREMGLALEDLNE